MNGDLIRLHSLKNREVIADKCYVAVRFLDRLKGLIGKNALEKGEGMLFPDCNNVHMWFMRIPIDVVFLRVEKGADGSMRRFVSSVRENVRPWRPLPVMDARAHDTLELPAGTVKRCEIAKGDELCTS